MRIMSGLRAELQRDLTRRMKELEPYRGRDLSGDPLERMRVYVMFSEFLRGYELYKRWDELDQRLTDV